LIYVCPKNAHSQISKKYLQNRIIIFWNCDILRRSIELDAAILAGSIGNNIFPKGNMKLWYIVIFGGDLYFLVRMQRWGDLNFLFPFLK
jgi:hypothetical protein